AKANWSGRSSTRAPVLRVSAPQPWLVSRSRPFQRARLSPDFAFSAGKAVCRFYRISSLRSSRGSGLTQRRQRSPRCLSRSVKPRSDRPPAKRRHPISPGRFVLYTDVPGREPMERSEAIARLKQHETELKRLGVEP